MSVTPLLAKRLGADRSFERLYRRHVAEVYRYSLAMLRNPADAEDVTQTTFLNAYRAYRRGERPHAAQRWLIAIAHNVCRQRFRQARRRVEEVAYDETTAEAIVPDGDRPSVDELRRALGHLAFNQRAALVMRELEGRSYAEIGEVLGVTTNAVETLLFRARRALREQLDGQLSCPEAELAVSRQLDGRLPRREKGALRAHLRECKDCSSLARKLRAQRSAIKAIGLVPLPASLGTLFGGGTAAVGGGVAMKAAAFAAASVLVAGAGHEASVHSPFKAQGKAEPAAAAVPAEAAPAAQRAVLRREATQAPDALVRVNRPKALPAKAAAIAPRQRAKAVPPGLAKPEQAAKPVRKAVKPVRTSKNPTPKRAKPTTTVSPPRRAVPKKVKPDRASRAPTRPTKPTKVSHGKGNPGPAGGTAPGGDEGTSSP